MKAKDYYEKYNEDILALPEGKERGERLVEIFHDFEKEQMEIIEKRRARSDAAIAGVIREQNQKWNALVRIFEKHNDGHAPLKRNGIKHVWERRLPQLNGLI